MIQDKTKKIVLVLRKDLESWQLTNTVGHLSAFLGANIGKEKITSVSTFKTKDSEIPADSQYPVITMAAKSSEQLFNLLKRVEENNLIHLAFTKDMIDYNDDVELADALVKQDKSKLDYLGIGIFGENEIIVLLTKKFSLWK